MCRALFDELANQRKIGCYIGSNLCSRFAIKVVDRIEVLVARALACSSAQRHKRRRMPGATSLVGFSGSRGPERSWPQLTAP